MAKRPRNIRDSRRRPAFREMKDRILIVCEGSETEPNYFNHLLRQLRLSSAKVLVVGKECGAAPVSVVDYAIDEIRQAVKNNNPYDQVWCVCDVEIREHHSLNKAYDMVATYQSPKKCSTALRMTLTNPFFEFWYILHFEKTSRTYNSNKELLVHLKRYLPNYQKNDNTPTQIYPSLENAMANAQAIIRENHYGEDLRNCNPSTHVHLLAQYLQEVASR